MAVEEGKAVVNTDELNDTLLTHQVLRKQQAGQERGKETDCSHLEFWLKALKVGALVAAVTQQDALRVSLAAAHPAPRVGCRVCPADGVVQGGKVKAHLQP